MAEALMLLVLQKIGASLAESATSGITSKLVEDISALREFNDSMKKIQSEFKVMQAYIRQVDLDLYTSNNKTFEAWLEELRKVAYEVEDIVDEYAYLTGQQQTSGMTRFIRKTFPCSRKNAALRNIADQLKKLEGRLQNLTSMKNRYDISITKRGESSNANYDQRVSESSDITSEDDDIVGLREETKQLLNWLTDDAKQGRRIISICGMGGLGKTTLARRIYKNEKIERHFACSAWVSVSQNFQVDDLFRRIAKELLPKNQAIPNDIDTQTLVKTLRSHLQRRRYLIVLDDMWSKDAWLLLKHAFVENNCGSRVVITTRIEDVSLLGDEGCQMKLTTLPKEEAWGLFCKKAFERLDQNRCPETLKYWAEKIVEKCQGLPLAIVAIGSLLAYKEKKEEEWRSFYDQLNWQLENNPELNWVAHRVLDLSFMDLPGYLKNCFLYCGLFPEDSRIRKDQIIRLWIAEGFIEQRGPRMTMEEVGEVYINELVHRCLLQVVERGDFGRVDEFQIHDVVREITITKSWKEMFGNSHDNTETIQLGDGARRLFIKGGKEIILQSSTGSRQLRTFLLFDDHLSSSCIHNVSSSFKLLRVLSLRGTNIDRVPAAVAELFNLRYLDLSYTKVKDIPRSLGKLLNLQTLDLSYTDVSKLPKEVKMLQKLRHLFIGLTFPDELSVYCTGFFNLLDCLLGGPSDFDERSLDRMESFDCITGASAPDEICNITSLQTLRGIEASRVLVQKIGNLTLLNLLTITKMRRSYCEALWASLAKMPRLRTLCVVASNPNEILNLEKLRPLPSLQDMDLHGRLEGWAMSSSTFRSFENLRNLRMGWSGLCEDPLPALSTMSNLVTLKLHRAYDGQGLAFHTGWFPKLKALRLFKLPQLVCIDIKDGAMKNLQELYLYGLPNLVIVPEGIKYLKSIQKMYLWEMPKDFKDRVKRTDFPIVEHIPNIDYN